MFISVFVMDDFIFSELATDKFFNPDPVLMNTEFFYITTLASPAQFDFMRTTGFTGFSLMLGSVTNATRA